MKKYRKRIIPIILVISLSITWISMPNGKIKSYAEETPSAGLLSDTTIRGVADTLEDLPQYGDPDYLSKARGTAERPFVVLELVPYEEYAEFGYHIGGCEPVEIERMHGYGDMTGVASMGDAKVEQKSAYYFTDEPESDEKLYDGKPAAQNWYQFDLKGYYELVEEGSGNFRQVQIEPEANGLMTTEAEETETAETEETETTETKQPETEQQTTEMPGTEMPGTEQQTTEMPGMEMPGTEIPGTEMPGMEMPGTEQQTTEVPETEAPSTEIPGTEQQTTEEPETEQPETEVPETEVPETEMPETEVQATELPEPEATETTEIKEPETQVKTPETRNADVRGEAAEPTNEEPEETRTTEEVTSGKAQREEAAEEEASVTKKENPPKVRSGNEEEVIIDSFATEAVEENSEADELEEEATLHTNALPDPQKKIVLENKINDMLKAAGQEIQIVPEVGGNLVWHTVQDFELAEYESKGITFTDPVGKVLVNVGDRIYTTRRSSAEDAAVKTDTYYTYQNYEKFLTLSLGLTQEEAAEFSVLVKTITPDALNANPEWVDYADLIYLAPKTHVGTVVDLWKKYNRLHKTPAAEYRNNEFEYNDLTWETTLRLYNKITAKTNYAPIIMDDNFYNNIGQNGMLTSKTVKTGVKMRIYDWNLQPATDAYGKEFSPREITGSNNNIWKLAIMLLCMDSSLFHNLYLKGDDPIVKDGKCTLQTGDAADYWTVDTFFLLKPGKNPWDYWDSAEFWESFHSASTFTGEQYKYWVNGRVFTFKGDTSTSQRFDQELTPNKEKFKDYYEWLDGKKPSAASAIEFILSYGENAEEQPDSGTLRVLDLEPSVGLKNDEFFSLDWGLSETYLYMMFPFFDGDIEVVHQTTAEFIGKTEDLGSSYAMIYLGLDCGAYNTTTMSMQLSSGSWVSLMVPDWNDNSLDGLIYLHSMDAIKSAETTDVLGTRSVKWLWSYDDGRDVADADTLRFQGNDISRKKQRELEAYVSGGHPVIAEEYLYNLERKLIDPATYISQFVNAYKGKGIYSATDTDGIRGAVGRYLQERSHVTFTGLPLEYNGATAGADSAVVSNPQYLPVDGSGTPYLEFGFSVDAEGYAYNVYIDKNRDGKFGADEKAADQAPAAVGANAFGCQIAGWQQTVGQVLWKIEVYNVANPSNCYVRTGCSAAGSVSSGRGKKEVQVLQIMPKDSEKDGAYQGELNLEKSGLFRKYYENLADYKVTVKTISAEEYESYFYGETTDASGRVTKTSYGFSYTYDRNFMENKDVVVNEDKLQGGLSNYDIIVVGFGADFAQRDLDNTYGAVDYLRYFQGQPDRSIIFTHDVTSMYNKASGGKNPTGYTANMLLRDIMGMKRYQSMSNQLPAAKREEIRKYQQMQIYDVLWYTTQSEGSGFLPGQNGSRKEVSKTYEQNHGYTYYAMKRLGGVNGKMPYRYLITNPAGAAVNAGNTTGFYDSVDLTTRAVKVNEGQIASYPYKIDSEIGIAPTHAQWYQLSPEDEDLTVWYCLAADGNLASVNQGSAGNSLTYQVSPNDAMNNYYVYSRGNVYYSGIGHSEAVSDMEAKLFVNTMIAAYRDNDREDVNVTYEPPVIEIENDEKIEVSEREYSIEHIGRFDGLQAVGAKGALYGIDGTIDSEYAVRFKPTDPNTVPAQLECTIQYKDESGNVVYADEVQDAGGTVIRADENHKFTTLQKDQEYILKYPMKYLVEDVATGRNALRTVDFEIKNDLSEETNITTVRMTLQPLFPLD